MGLIFIQPLNVCNFFLQVLGRGLSNQSADSTA